jgi:hypothetical protein
LTEVIDNEILLLICHLIIYYGSEYLITKIRFYSEELLAPRPTPKLEDHPLSAVRDCLFNTFAATLLTGGRSSIRKTRTPIVEVGRERRVQGFGGET